MQVEQVTELTVSVPHEAGQLARVLEAMRERSIGVRAFCGYGYEGGATVQFIPDDLGSAREALETIGLEPDAREVVLARTPAGSRTGAELAVRIASAGINLAYAYATADDGAEHLVVLAAEEPDAVLEALAREEVSDRR